MDRLTMKGEERKDAESRYKADRDGFVEVVFCVEEGKAVAKQVKTGIQSDELIEILEGLSDGDEIITGSYRAISKDLDNGAVVTIKQQAEEDAGAEQGDVAAE
jgi:HlyD family secretion protein